MTSYPEKGCFLSYRRESFKCYSNQIRLHVLVLSSDHRRNHSRFVWNGRVRLWRKPEYKFRMPWKQNQNTLLANTFFGNGTKFERLKMKIKT